MSAIWIYLMGSVACAAGCGWLLWRLSRMSHAKHGVVGNDEQVGRPVQSRRREDVPSGIVTGMSSAVDTTKVVRKTRPPKP